MMPLEILQAGKAAIETRGWCQGDEAAIFGRDGRCCAATALLSTQLFFDFSTPSGLSFPGNRAMLLLKAAAGIAATDPIAAWNDAPERSKEEVLAAYDKAIALAEQEGV